jgi:hypothetical protein
MTSVDGLRSDTACRQRPAAACRPWRKRSAAGLGAWDLSVAWLGAWDPWRRWSAAAGQAGSLGSVSGRAGSLGSVSGHASGLLRASRPN